MHQWWIDCRAPGKYWDHWSAAERPLTGPHEGGRSLVVAPERQRLSILHFSEKRAEMISMCYSKFYMCQITEDNPPPQASGQWTLHTDVKLENSRRFFCPLFQIAPSLPWEDPKEVAGSPLNGAQWHLKYCC